MKSLNILCIGDIVGRPGRTVLQSYLTQIQKKYRIHFTIANIENSSGGFGVTDKVYKELKLLPIQAFTSGNHIYDKKEILNTLQDYSLLIRPLNFPKGNPGVGYRIFTINEHKIAVINLIGRVFMGNYDCPFQTIEYLLPEIQKQADIIIVDFHAEATSEKQALGWFLDGSVACVYGTHTHVMTADDRILEKGTAFISDVGFVGALNSILGMTKEPIITKFFNQMPAKFEVPKTGPSIFNGIVIEVDLDQKIATSIQRIQEIFN